MATKSSLRINLSGGEELERRAVLSVQMTAAETMLLHLVNQARNSPEAYASRLSVSLSQEQRGPFAPLTANTFLLTAARSHSVDMQTRGYFSHFGQDGSSPGQRAVRAGYPTQSVGENIYMDAGYSSYAAEAVARRLNDGWFKSSGHRANMLNRNWTQFGGGVHVVTSSRGSVHGTELFGRHDAGPFVTGVVYRDTNNDGEYNVGEGLSGVTVSIGSLQATTNEFGNYELRVSSGSHTISASGEAFGTPIAVSWLVGNANVKVDFRAGQAGAVVNFQPVGGAPPPGSLPEIRIGDVEVIEGDNAAVLARFPVTLSAAATETVTVDFATVDGSATVADGDYVAARPGSFLVFAPGETLRYIEIPIIGDRRDEADESFAVVLTQSSPNVSLGNTRATALIRDNDEPGDGGDGSTTSLILRDAAAVEGGTTVAAVAFTVRLQNPVSHPVFVSYETRSGTAVSGVDYARASGRLLFLPGQTVKRVRVGVRNDRLAEQDEYFFLDVAAQGNQVAQARQSVKGWILDDDSRFYAITAPQGPVRPGQSVAFDVGLSRLEGYGEALPIDLFSAMLPAEVEATIRFAVTFDVRSFRSAGRGRQYLSGVGFERSRGVLSFGYLEQGGSLTRTPTVRVNVPVQGADAPRKIQFALMGSTLARAAQTEAIIAVGPNPALT